MARVTLLLRFIAAGAFLFPAGALAQISPSAAPLASFEQDPIRAFIPTTAVLHVDGFPGLADRGIPSVHVSGTRMDIVLNSDCGFLCPGVSPQTFDISLPALAPGNYEIVVIPTAGQASAGSLVATGTLKVASVNNYQGLWWASPAGVESGWGLQIAHQGETIFATWYTYDHDGSATWFVMPEMHRLSEGLYTGDLYRTSAAPGAASFNLTTSENTMYEGVAYFEFRGADDGTFRYEVNGLDRSKRITRQIFSPDPTSCGYSATLPRQSNYQDLWWNAPAGSESGWGVQIAHQGDTIFATVFGYDAAGKGRWLVMPDARETTPGVFAGAVYSTRGPAYDANPWNPADVSVRPEGRGELAFSGSSLGTFSVSPDQGSTIALQKSITRQEFSAFKTACQ